MDFLRMSLLFALVSPLLLPAAAQVQPEAAAPPQASSPAEQKPADLKTRLNALYAGQFVTIRNFYKDDALEYDAQGSPVGNPRPGRWTEDGLIRIEKIEVLDDRVQLRAVREEPAFTSGNGRQVFFIDSGKGRRVFFFDRDPVLLSVMRTHSDDQLLSALAAIFLPDAELESAVPAEERELAHKWKADLSDGAYQVGGGVTAPRLVYKVESTYSMEARKAKWQGVVLLSFVVETDGRAHEIRVLKALGKGLDENAIEAVMQWRFEPGMKNGVPVPVEIRVQVNFHLY